MSADIERESASPRYLPRPTAEETADSDGDLFKFAGFDQRGRARYWCGSSCRSDNGAPPRFGASPEGAVSATQATPAADAMPKVGDAVTWYTGHRGHVAQADAVRIRWDDGGYSDLTLDEFKRGLAAGAVDGLGQTPPPDAPEIETWYWSEAFPSQLYDTADECRARQRAAWRDYSADDSPPIHEVELRKIRELPGLHQDTPTQGDR